MLFLINALWKKVEITILTAWDITRLWLQAGASWVKRKGHVIVIYASDSTLFRAPLNFFNLVFLHYRQFYLCKVSVGKVTMYGKMKTLNVALLAGLFLSNAVNNIFYLVSLSFLLINTSELKIFRELVQMRPKKCPKKSVEFLSLHSLYSLHIALLSLLCK